MNGDTVTLTVPVSLARTMKVFERVMNERRSGQLRVNFSQGAPTESLQWLEGISNWRPPLGVALDRDLKEA
jgi:hypothetical protein